jgi:dihydrolipoamide dehydrogenase
MGRPTGFSGNDDPVGENTKVPYLKGRNMATVITLDSLVKNAKQGKVGKISVKVNDPIKIGDKILQVESVKGNTIVKSKVNGTVTNVLVAEGTQIKIGQNLIEIEKAE